MILQPPPRGAAHPYSSHSISIAPAADFHTSPFSHAPRAGALIREITGHNRALYIVYVHALSLSHSDERARGRPRRSINSLSRFYRGAETLACSGRDVSPVLSRGASCERRKLSIITSKSVLEGLS